MVVEKYGGRDCELSSTGVDQQGKSIDPSTVSCNVLAQIPAAFEEFGGRTWSRHKAVNYASPYSMDSHRHWATSGGCVYIDLAHVEICTPSCLHPTTFAAQCLANLLVVEEARRRAERVSDGDIYSLTTSNADALDPAISFGTHISISIATSLWEDLFVDQRHPAILGFVSSAMAAAIAFFGAGYLLPLKNGATVFSLSARAHHLSKLHTLSTTDAFRRGLLNSRREPHGKDQERLHLIGFDHCVLCSALLFSFLQCALAAAEEGFCGMNLYDPVLALQQWSWSVDPQTGRLPGRASLVDGRQLTLPAYIQELTAKLLEMCEAGLISPAVAPQATDMLPRIIDLAGYAAEGSVGRCAKHLTWAAKLLWLTQLCNNEGARLGDAQTRLADHDFTHTNPDKGPLWRLWDAGMVDPMVEISQAKACLTEGPAESRDWGRGQIIRRFSDRVWDVDWSFVDLIAGAGNRRWSPKVRISLPHLDTFSKKDAAVIDAAVDPEHLSQLLSERNGDDVEESCAAGEVKGNWRL